MGLADALTTPVVEGTNGHGVGKAANPFAASLDRSLLEGELADTRQQLHGALSRLADMRLAAAVAQTRLDELERARAELEEKAREAARRGAGLEQRLKATEEALSSAQQQLEEAVRVAKDSAATAAAATAEAGRAQAEGLQREQRVAAMAAAKKESDAAAERVLDCLRQQCAREVKQKTEELQALTKRCEHAEGEALRLARALTEAEARLAVRDVQCGGENHACKDQAKPEKPEALAKWRFPLLTGFAVAVAAAAVLVRSNGPQP